MDSNAVESDKILDELALAVMKKYGITPDNVSIVQGGTIKTIWKVRANRRQYCLKRLKHSYDKALFSVNAQIYVKNSGGNVPEVFRDKNNLPIIQHDNQLFVLYEWLDGRDLDLNDLSDLSHAIKGLAKFHISSKGYRPVPGARTSSKLGKWPEQYGSMKNKLEAWRHLSQNNMQPAFHASYQKYTGPILDIANEACALLERSSYGSMISSCLEPLLCHQDFGRGNVILTDSGAFVIDLDGVTFDLAARDLRKIIGKRAENKGQWNIDFIKYILGEYMEINPQSPAEKRILYIDLMFPHWYFGLVKNFFQKDKPLKQAEIQKIAELEQQKVPILRSLLKEGG